MSKGTSEGRRQSHRRRRRGAPAANQQVPARAAGGGPGRPPQRGRPDHRRHRFPRAPPRGGQSADSGVGAWMHHRDALGGRGTREGGGAGVFVRSVQNSEGLSDRYFANGSPLRKVRSSKREQSATDEVGSPFSRPPRTTVPGAERSDRRRRGGPPAAGGPCRGPRGGGRTAVRPGHRHPPPHPPPSGI